MMDDKQGLAQHMTLHSKVTKLGRARTRTFIAKTRSLGQTRATGHTGWWREGGGGGRHAYLNLLQKKMLTTIP